MRKNDEERLVFPMVVQQDEDQMIERKDGEIKQLYWFFLSSGGE